MEQVMLASPNCATVYKRMPAKDHPLYAMFRQYNLLREMEILADLECEKIAPVPMTMAEADWEDRITDRQTRDRYFIYKSRRQSYSHAAYMLDNAIHSVLDSLGGM